jgi:hypothetical protein
MFMPTSISPPASTGATEHHHHQEATQLDSESTPGTTADASSTESFIQQLEQELTELEATQQQNGPSSTSASPLGSVAAA